MEFIERKKRYLILRIYNYNLLQEYEINQKLYLFKYNSNIKYFVYLIMIKFDKRNIIS